MPEPVVVRVRDCACPDSPHADGDEVYLRPMLDLDGGMRAEQELIAHSEEPNLLIRLWWETFVRHGATGWNLLDADGAPVPFDVETILADYRLARPVADAANTLYSGTILSPFLTEQEARSPTGQTPPTTSPPPTPIRKRSA